MRFLLITVTDASDGSRACLAALLASVERQAVEVDIVLVMRGGGQPPDPGAAHVRIHPLERPEVIALSRARNDALARARELGLLAAADIVAFPDDDCRYPDGLLAEVTALLDGGLEIVSGSYGPSRHRVDRRRFPSGERSLSPLLVMALCSSATAFVRAHAVAAVGLFDERFGLGARFGASEDADYLLRALRLGIRGAYAPDAFVEHPYKPQRAAQYYLGNVAVLAKHARGGGTIWRLVRRLAYGPLLMARRQLPLREYGRALGATGRLLFDRSP